MCVLVAIGVAPDGLRTNGASHRLVARRRTATSRLDARISRNLCPPEGVEDLHHFCAPDRALTGD